MKPESAMRQRISKILRQANKAPTPVENTAMPGTPDLSFVEAWMELKRIESWPKRAETFVRVRDFTPKQRAWLKRRHRAGGKVYFLLQAGRDWILLPGHVAADIVDRSTKQELIDEAIKYWRNGLNEKEFVKCLAY